MMIFIGYCALGGRGEKGASPLGLRPHPRGIFEQKKLMERRLS